MDELELKVESHMPPGPWPEKGACHNCGFLSIQAVGGYEPTFTWGTRTGFDPDAPPVFLEASPARRRAGAFFRTQQVGKDRSA